MHEDTIPQNPIDYGHDERYIHLLEEGLSESVAAKIVKNTHNNSEMMQKLNMLIEGVKRYRIDFKGHRYPKFETQ